VPTAELPGAALPYEITGPPDGEPLVMVMGTGASGRAWHLHQVPALVAAGFRTITFDARGVAATAPCPGGITIEEMVGDVAGLIGILGTGPAHVVGTSLGARVTQELALTRPELVRSAVALAAHARLDPVQRAHTEGEIALIDSGVELPARYRAAIDAVLNLAPATLADARTANDWLDVLEFAAGRSGPGLRAQLAVSGALDDRRDAYRDIRVPLLVVGFAQDRVIPPALSREVADAVPGAVYAEIADAGHYGYLERPEQVNRLIVDFLLSNRRRVQCASSRSDT